MSVFIHNIANRQTDDIDFKIKFISRGFTKSIVFFFITVMIEILIYEFTFFNDIFSNSIIKQYLTLDSLPRMFQFKKFH